MYNRPLEQGGKRKLHIPYMVHKARQTEGAQSILAKLTEAREAGEAASPCRACEPGLGRVQMETFI